MSKNKTFSIIIPLYNKAKYICKTIDSVLVQSFDDFEIIVVDDGSTDDSKSIVQNHYKHLNNLSIITQTNAGPAAARNTGVKYASGDWVLFLDADDLLLPEALDIFSSLIKKNRGIDYIICNYYIQCNGKKSLFQIFPIEGILKHPFFYEFAGWMSDRPGSAIYKREMVLRFPFNPKLRRYEDAECQYEMLNEVKVYQSKMPVMISNRDASEAASYRQDINEDFLGHLDFKGKTFWERMMLYKLALQAVDGYGVVAKNMYEQVLNKASYKIVLNIFSIIWIFERIVKKLMKI